MNVILDCNNYYRCEKCQQPLQFEAVTFEVLRERGYSVAVCLRAGCERRDLRLRVPTDVRLIEVIPDGGA
jgi:hypothetical protein